MVSGVFATGVFGVTHKATYSSSDEFAAAEVATKTMHGNPT